MNLIADYTNLFYPKKAGKVSPVFKDISGVGMIGTGTAATAWKGLSTTGKVAVGAGAGILSTSAYNWLFGGKTPSQATTQNPIQNTITKTKTISNTSTTSIIGDWSTNIIENSQGASFGKKSLSGTTSPISTVSPDVSVSPAQTATSSQAAGTDMTTIAIIAAVAILGAGYLSGRKRK